MARSSLALACFLVAVVVDAQPVPVPVPVPAPAPMPAPAPAPMMVDCEALLDTFDPDIESCPEGLPGEWTECDDDCGDGLQSAVDMFDCCVLDFLLTRAGDGAPFNYSFMAFRNVVPLCELDVSGVQRNCTELLPMETPAPPPALTGCDAEVADYGTPDDRIRASGDCPNVTLPGMWDTCSPQCGELMQDAFDELNCCVYNFIEDFAGEGDHSTYADMAFPHVVQMCNIDTSDLEGDCTDLLGIDGAATVSISMAVSLGLTAGAAALALL